LHANRLGIKANKAMLLCRVSVPLQAATVLKGSCSNLNKNNF